ncbi:D-aminoacyl-tRNA deacylase [Rothia sp. CCM 9418]|uniref:D-aminoacyl-tRNA deacylase n=1 Tax=Rothia sp. CCM 9418 TaxID=3402661 RepID=UPI003AD89AFD
MKVVIQRVQQAKVCVGGEQVGAISRPGLLALVGITHTDTPEIVKKLAEKTWKLRLLEGEKSCSDIGAPILAVSQFTLYADSRRGRRPSWSAAAGQEIAEPLFNSYVQHLKDLGAEVSEGIFGADMQVSLINDGPVTIILDSDEL